MNTGQDIKSERRPMAAIMPAAITAPEGRGARSPTDKQNQRMGPLKRRLAEFIKKVGIKTAVKFLVRIPCPAARADKPVEAPATEMPTSRGTQQPPQRSPR